MKYLNSLYFLFKELSSYAALNLTSPRPQLSKQTNMHQKYCHLLFWHNLQNSCSIPGVAVTVHRQAGHAFVWKKDSVRFRRIGKLARFSANKSLDFARQLLQVVRVAVQLLHVKPEIYGADGIPSLVLQFQRLLRRNQCCSGVSEVPLYDFNSTSARLAFYIHDT